MFTRFVYDASSRYARPEAGDVASVKALDRATVERFYLARYRPHGSTLILVGDINVADGVALAQVGHVGLPRSHPDYFPVLIVNALLGGLFSSRINLNLREVHAYTYGAHSSFDWRRAAGPFVVSTAVKSDVTADASKEILLEISRIRADAVSEDELTLATSYLDGVFPIRYETTDSIARALAALAIYELPNDYFDSYRANIRRVTAMDVLHAADKYLHPDHLQLVVVGDASVIAAPLAALDVGPVSVYDSNGQPER
jgi:zinc protease